MTNRKINQSLKPGQKPNSKLLGEDLGDMYFGMETVAKYAKEDNQTIQEKMRILIIHGLCHLMGHRHHNDKYYNVVSLRSRETEKMNMEPIKKKNNKTAGKKKSINT